MDWLQLVYHGLSLDSNRDELGLFYEYPDPVIHRTARAKTTTHVVILLMALLQPCNMLSSAQKREITHIRGLGCSSRRTLPRWFCSA